MGCWPISRADALMSRLDVRKTYKLYINGEFPGRSRVAPIRRSIPRVRCWPGWPGSRKDLREAVRAARTAQAKWAERSGYNRGQILYRIAEMIEDRKATFEEQLEAGGVSPAAGPNRSRQLDRSDGLVRRMGRQVLPDLRQPQPGGWAVTSTSRRPNRPVWSA